MQSSFLKGRYILRCYRCNYSLALSLSCLAASLGVRMEWLSQQFPDHLCRVLPVVCWIFWFVALGSPGAVVVLSWTSSFDSHPLAGVLWQALFLPCTAVPHVFLHVGSSCSLSSVLEKLRTQDQEAGRLEFVTLLV